MQTYTLKWLLQPCYDAYSQWNGNAESVNTHINIYPVAVLGQLLVRQQLIQAETIDTIMIVFSKI